MSKKKKPQIVQVKVVFTEGYEKRFTEAVLKVYESRLRAAQQREREREQQEEVG